MIAANLLGIRGSVRQGRTKAGVARERWVTVKLISDAAAAE